MIRRPPRSTLSSSSAASDVYKRHRARRAAAADLAAHQRRLSGRDNGARRDPATRAAPGRAMERAMNEDGHYEAAYQLGYATTALVMVGLVVWGIVALSRRNRSASPGQRLARNPRLTPRSWPVA